MIDILNRRLMQPLMAWRSGSQHLRHLRVLRERQFDDLDTIRGRQFDAVRKILFHAYETVPFYRNLFICLGFHPSDFKSLADLTRFPVLTKADIRAHQRTLRSSSYDDRDVFLKKTSGSTGVPLTIAVDFECMQWKAACTIRSDEWSGWRQGRRVAKVWGNPEYRQQGWKGRVRNFLVDRARYLDTIGLDEPRMQTFAESLRQKQPSLLFGHAHSLYLFACYVRKHFRDAIRPEGIISTAMLLHDWQRQAIEEAFGCSVTNRYGCEEVSLIACECERHQGLHLNADSQYAEVIEDRDIPGEGSLIVTDLTNRAMPLIRYKVGDVVVKSNRRCTCGRGLPLIERVEGREADFVLTPAGKLISGISLTENFALHIRGTAQVQIVQESERFLRLRIVPDEDFGPESEWQIQQLVHEMFGPEMDHEVDLVERIPQEASGKYRFCISNVANDFLKAMAS
ncbi:MAG: phenylacetate--CoA ligase family protein [Planctomycetes bacterium]|nr:phenylacetate--CoA ligase family protein [Planctomycetota bacterium]